VLPVLALRTGDIMEIGTNSNHVGSDFDEFVASAQVASNGFEFPMKHVPIALLIFVAPAFAEELPVNPAATQATIGRTICKPGWTNAVRLPFRVTDQIKRDKLRAAGWTDADKNRFELDYIIPLSLGGAPDDPKNFLLEPGNEVVERKALEACLPRLVCERRLMLDEARKSIWRDWRAALSLCRD
jgi:hypothetical protein